MENLLLQVKDLMTYFYTDDGVVKAVDGVDFTIRKGETLGMVVSQVVVKALLPFPY